MAPKESDGLSQPELGVEDFEIKKASEVSDRRDTIIATDNCSFWKVQYLSQALRRRTGYWDSLNSSRPINMRRISLVPAPISYSLASRSSRPGLVSLM